MEKLNSESKNKDSFKNLKGSSPYERETKTNKYSFRSIEDLSDEEIEAFIKKETTPVMITLFSLLLLALILTLIRPDFIYKDYKILKYLIWILPAVVGLIQGRTLAKYDQEKKRRLDERWKANKD